MGWDGIKYNIKETTATPAQQSRGSFVTCYIRFHDVNVLFLFLYSSEAVKLSNDASMTKFNDISHE
jgi:hypothetical protein